MRLGQYSARVRPAGENIKASVGGDSIEPAAKRGPSFEVVEPTPGVQEHLLDETRVADQPPTVIAEKGTVDVIGRSEEYRREAQHGL
jgi:hypothetical protein